MLCRYFAKCTASSAAEVKQRDGVETDAQYACTYNAVAIFQPDPFPHLIIHRDKHCSIGNVCETTALLCFAWLPGPDRARPQVLSRQSRFQKEVLDQQQPPTHLQGLLQPSWCDL